MSDKESSGGDGKTTSTDNGASLDVCAAVSEQEKQLATSAATDFHAGKYGACLETLDKLYALRPADGKVAHNRAVARYYASSKSMEEFGRELVEISPQLHVSLANPDSLDDIDQCIPFFNHAVALFHAQQYRRALAVLDRLFQFIEPMDESVARKMCFLHIELCLCLKQPEKGLATVAYLEQLGNKADSPEAEACRGRLQLYKTRCLIMMRSVKASKREIKNLVSSSAGSSCQTVFLRSQLEFLRGNYRKAVKVLATAQQGDARTVAMYHNNLGCVHFCTGKPHLGSYSFAKALNSYVEGCSQGDDTLDGRVYFELLYNLGLQNLYCGKYASAFDCLVEAARMQPTNARLWLRIAECCVNRHKSDNATDFQLKDRKRYMVSGTAGAGPHRKIILAPSISSDRRAAAIGSAAIPVPTLEFAALCLRNVLQLLPDPSPTEASVLPEDAAVDAATSSPLQGADDALRNSALALAAYVALCLGDPLVALKHAESLLAQPKVAGVHSFLAHQYAAEALLLLDRVGDAIDHLNPDLIKDLSYGFSDPEDGANKGKDDVAKTGASEENGKTYRKPWYPASPSMAKVVSLYNLAVAYTLRGGLGKATETLRLVSVPKGPDPEIPVQALMLAIYVQLQQGHADLAKNIIKQHLPQYK
ncbi:CCR4-NOT transcription complex subunit 10 [Dermacentor andersoni]|uniref:CCR4-NOT transcription complex subunit 10 n=1 Tax=Dermacentor andersoni TaxID=34620 RepID=UPI002155B800|nr:CCR4-NOT transcription complex subunit 10-like [Dermacentor andersoni]